jgi:RHS repeat-associated protein
MYDGNFNVTGLIGTDGTVVERYVYDPYGKVSFLDGSWGALSASAYDNQILYCGYRYDPESGLYQVRYRYYHPTLGRWTARDKIGYVDGMSLYEYVRGSPKQSIDPTGLRTETIVASELDKSARLTTDWCCREDEVIITKAVGSAFRVVHDVMASLLNIEEETVPFFEFRRFFYSSYILAPIPTDDLNKVYRAYAAVFDGMKWSPQNDPFALKPYPLITLAPFREYILGGIHAICEGKNGLCADGRSAYAEQDRLGTRTIHICHNFVHGITDHGRVMTIIHEVLHGVAFAEDFRGLVGPKYYDGRDKDDFPIYSEGEMVSGQFTGAKYRVSVSKAERLIHADTLAAFAMLWYKP